MANASASSFSSISKPTPIPVVHHIQTTLTSDNFLLWRSQVLPVLRGHGLMSFVDGSQSPPPSTIPGGDGLTNPNPEFVIWQQQDQLILAWLFSSLSPSMLAQVVNCDTSASLWQTITQIHTSQSMAKVLDMKLQLQTMKKGDSPCAEYLQQMQGVADRLRSIGSVILDQDLVIYTIQGLGTEFDNFVTTISMKDTTPSMAELTNLLLAHEARILTNLKSSSTQSVHLTTGQNQSKATNTEQTALYTQGGRGKPMNSSFANNNNSQFSSNRGRGNSYRGKSSYRGRGRGRQTSFSSNQDTSPCQICNRWGHGALECYHRFDIRYSNSNNNSTTHQALLVEPGTSSQNAWYIDSGATSHVTSDINNLSSVQQHRMKPFILEMAQVCSFPILVQLKFK